MTAARSVEDIDRTLIILSRAGRDDPDAVARVDRLLELRYQLTSHGEDGE